MGAVDDPQLTIEWCTAELMRLTKATRPEEHDDEFVVPVLDRNQIATVSEHRKLVGQLLDIARDETIAKLVAANEKLLAELDLLGAATEGHAQRSNSAVTPPVTPSRKSN